MYSSSLIYKKKLVHQTKQRAFFINRLNFPNQIYMVYVFCSLNFHKSAHVKKLVIEIKIDRGWIKIHTDIL